MKCCLLKSNAISGFAGLSGPIRMTQTSINDFNKKWIPKFKTQAKGMLDIRMEGSLSQKAAAYAYRCNILITADSILGSYFADKDALRQKMLQEIGEDDRGDINAKNLVGDTPLHIAARQENSADTLKFLLREKADVDIRNGDNKTAFELAKEGERAENLKVLQNPDAMKMEESSAIVSM
jgi:ankyrin repeat protein